MPAKAPLTNPAIDASLHQLGTRLREHRKQLGISATVAAEAAGMSRITWHRIEQGNPSVTMGAWMSAAAVLGLELQVLQPGVAHAPAADEHLPLHIVLADYPQLQRLAWHVRGTDAFTLTPREALDIYERNARHLDLAAMDAGEQRLLANLRQVLGGTIDGL
jgi:transcriptional regulator with XRE-family HTH domain